jgi:large subunit ribosomal protein L21
MYAYIESGGKQYKVEAGQNVLVEKLEGEPGSEISFDRVIAVVGGKEPVFGTPYIEKASVTGEIVKTEKQKKVMVFKQLTRKNSRKLRGHRQTMTTVKIKDIQGV